MTEAMPAQLTALPLAVGVVCAQRLRALGAAAVKVKWPNDLVAGGRKLAGILIEHRGEGGGSCRVVVGIGLNLALQAQQASDIAQPWVNLPELLDAVPSRNAVAADLLGALATLLADYPRRGFAPHAQAWEELDATRERAVKVQLGDQIGRAHV